MRDSLSALAPDLYPIALALLGGLLAMQTVRLWWAHAGPALRLRLRQRRGSAGEREAEGLLRKAGYAIVERQPAARVTYGLGGQPLTVQLRGDLLVRRGSRRLLAEVKTGRVAPRLHSAETRRQLLEYAHAFAVDGLLLVDADQGTVREVALPERLVDTPRPPRPGLLSQLVWALCVGAALGASALYYALELRR